MGCVVGKQLIINVTLHEVTHHSKESGYAQWAPIVFHALGIVIVSNAQK